MAYFRSTIVRYAMAYHNYAECLYRVRLLTIRLLVQGYVVTRLKSSLKKFHGRHHELVDLYGVSICTMKANLFNVS